MDVWQIILIVLVLIVIVLYLVILPLAKRGALRKQAQAVDDMHKRISPGDRVVLIDGLIGIVASATAKELVVTLAPSNVAVTVKRAGIAGVEKQASKEQGK